MLLLLFGSHIRRNIFFYRHNKGIRASIRDSYTEVKKTQNEGKAVEWIVVFLILLMIVWSISYGNRDPTSYQLSANVINNIVDDVPSSLHHEGFTQVIP